MNFQVTTMETSQKTRRVYNGPPKGSEAAKAQMEKVRAAQWAKNGLTFSSADTCSTSPASSR
jgi:hypothetical protein